MNLFFNTFILPHLWQGRVGRKPKLSLFKIFNYILKILYAGCQWKELPIDKDENGKPEIHYTSIYKKFVKWTKQGSCLIIFHKSLEKLQEQGKLDLSILHGDGTNTIAKKGGEGIGYNGYKHQKGEKTIAIHDNQGNIIAPLTIAPVNQSDMLLLKESINDLKRINSRLNLGIKKGTVLNLDSGFDSKANRKKIWNVGLKPNIKENKRNRKSTKKGRKRFFDSSLYKKRFVTIQLSKSSYFFIKKKCITLQYGTKHRYIGTTKSTKKISRGVVCGYLRNSLVESRKFGIKEAIRSK